MDTQMDTWTDRCITDAPMDKQTGRFQNIPKFCHLVNLVNLTIPNKHSSKQTNQKDIYM